MLDLGSIPILADRIIQLLNYRGESRRQLFNEHIEPIYRTSLDLQKELTSLYGAIIEELNHSPSKFESLAKTVKSKIEENRYGRLALHEYVSELKNKYDNNEDLLEFCFAAHGIFQLGQDTTGTRTLVGLIDTLILEKSKDSVEDSKLLTREMDRVLRYMQNRRTRMDKSYARLRVEYLS